MFSSRELGVDTYMSCDGYMVSADIFYMVFHLPKITIMLIEKIFPANI